MFSKPDTLTLVPAIKSTDLAQILPVAWNQLAWFFENNDSVKTMADPIIKLMRNHMPGSGYELFLLSSCEF